MTIQTLILLSFQERAKRSIYRKPHRGCVNRPTVQVCLPYYVRAWHCLVLFGYKWFWFFSLMSEMGRDVCVYVCIWQWTLKLWHHIILSDIAYMYHFCMTLGYVSITECTHTHTHTHTHTYTRLTHTHILPLTIRMSWPPMWWRWCNLSTDWLCWYRQRSWKRRHHKPGQRSSPASYRWESSDSIPSSLCSIPMPDST